MAIKTWTATNTHTYRGSKWRSQREMYQGDYTNNGNNIGFAWFNTSNITSTLSGQIIDKVEVYMHRVSSTHGHSWALPINLYTHKVTDGGSVSTGGFANKQTDVASFNRNEGKWFTVTNAVGEALRNGSANGIVIYHSANQDHYMIFDAYNSSYPPQLRITYHVANTAPTTPGSFTSPSSGTIYESSVSVSWGASTDVDGDTLTYYLEASINGGAYSQIYKGTGRTYSHNITGVTRGNSIVYRVRAHDGTVYSGYRGSSTCYRNRVPNTPSSFSAPTSNTRYESSIPVSWSASTDPNGQSVTYRLEVSINGGTYSQIYSGSSTSYTHSITGVTRGYSIRYRVRAHDGMAYSSYLTGSLCYRNNAPSTPAVFTSPSGTIKRESKTISWGHSTDDATPQASLQYEVGLSTNGGTSYSVIRSFATGNSFTYNFTNVSTNKNFASTNCYLRVRARDGSNVTSGYRTSSKFIIDFKEPPTLPGIFTGVGTSAENQTIAIGWGASTDPNEDAITYLVQFWNRSSWITIASANTTNSLSYKLPSVSAQYSDYKFRVRAQDATGLTSGYRESGTFTIIQDSAPSLAANTYSQRTMTTVKVSGRITNLGGHSLTQYGIKWGTSSSSLTSTVNLGARSTTGNFTGDITGLNGDTVYYARTYAINAKGTTLSSDLITIPKYNPPLYIDTLGVGIGKKRENGALDVAGDAYISGSLMTGARWSNYVRLVDLNDITDEWILGANGSNFPGSGHWYVNTILYTATAERKQIAYGYQNNEIYSRNISGGVWSDWTKVSIEGHGHTWGQISYKPSSFPPSEHNHREGELVSAYSTADMNTRYKTGLIGFAKASNSPATYGQGINLVSAGTEHNNSSNRITQLVFGTDGGVYFRSKANASAWGTWRTLWHDGNFNPANYSLSSNSHNELRTTGTENTLSGSTVLNASNYSSYAYPAHKIRSGWFSVTSSTAVYVAFSSAMSVAPQIVTGYSTGGALSSGDRGSINIYNVTASGFNAIIGGSNDTTAQDVNYIAINP